MTTTHEIEEMEFGRHSGLWDASEGVCCAYFQLGACAHTEDFDPETGNPYDLDPEVAWLDAAEASLPVQFEGEEPF